MRIPRVAIYLLPLILACCGKSGTAAASGGGTPEVPTIHAPPGDPESLPKVPADANAISKMLHERFGDAVAGNIRVEVSDQGAGKRVSLSGEVPNEEIRQAVMKELEARVPDMKSEDFTLELSGPIRQVFSFDANLGSDDLTTFSPDLSLAVTGDGDIYEVATGRRLNVVPPPEDDELESMAFSPDGKWLARGFQHEGIQLLQMPQGTNPRMLSPFSHDGNSGRIAAMQFTSDGKKLLTINTVRGELVLWDLAAGNSRTIGAHVPRDSARSLSDTYYLALSPDNSLAASIDADETAVSIWDIQARTRKFQLDDVRLSPEALAWSHDGKSLAAGRALGDQSGVALFDMNTHKGKVLATDEPGQISSLAFSPDDKTLAVGYLNNGIQLWDLATGKLWQTIPSAKTSSGHGLAFSPDGALLAQDGQTLNPPAIRLWDVSRRPGAAPAVAHLPAAVHVGAVQNDALATGIEQTIRGNFDPRNILELHVSVLPDGTIQLTGRVTDEEVKRVAGQDAAVFHLPGDVGQNRRNKVENNLEVVHGTFR